jgi:hypothetical protein
MTTFWVCPTCNEIRKQSLHPALGDPKGSDSTCSLGNDAWVAGD